MAKLNASPIHFKEAVCIDAEKIFDSCSDKDCLEDLQVFFTAEGQSVINNASLVKCKSADVVDVDLTVEPVLFKRGFYSVDITFYFKVLLATYASPLCVPVDVTGLACHCKKVVLYGGEDNVKSFRSDRMQDLCVVSTQLPVATLRCVSPLSLGARIVECCPVYTEPLGTVPYQVANCFNGELMANSAGGKTVLITLGLFIIVALQRDAQIMIPMYDYLVPDRECAPGIAIEEPCDIFRRIKFPVHEFFPDSTGTDEQ